ncbi:MAG: PulJ/GspJ family protein [Coraliomargarita sp.]
MIQTKQKSGFTLIEVMVATVIMVILVGMVVTITGRVLDVWSKSSGKLSANAEARIAMELLTQDLETAVFRKNGQQWLRVDGPVGIEGDYASQTVALKLFSPSLTRDKEDPDNLDQDGKPRPIPGDVCAIAYRLEYQEAYAGGSDKVYALYRSIERADDTFNNLLGSKSQTNSPQTDLVGQGFWDASDIVVPENYLASNIVDFQVFIYEEDATTPTNPPVLQNADQSTYELNSDYIYGGSTTDDDGNPLSGSTGRLLYADIILKVVSDEGLEILSLLADDVAGTGFTNEDEVILEHGQTFTRRVYFPASPL